MDELKEIALRNIGEFTVSSVGKTDILKDSKALVEKNPEIVAKTFYGYYKIVKGLFDLSSQDLELIADVNKKLGKQRGANEFIGVMGKHKESILGILRQAGNTDSDKNKKGINELTEMMNNAWNLKQKEPDWTPKDGDPRADNVIWGFVKGANNPLINIHFAICHGMERILTQHLKGEINEEYINHKDWLLMALNDVVTLKGLRKEGYEAEVIDMWSKKRPNGLGWINQGRKVVYKNIEYKNKIYSNILPEQKAFFDEFILRKNEKRLPKGVKFHDASWIYKSLYMDSEENMPLEERRKYLTEYLHKVIKEDGPEVIIFFRDELKLYIPKEIQRLIS